MKRIGLYSAISAAVMLAAACGGGGGGSSDGPAVTVDVPVGLWVETVAGEETLARQLYVLPVAGGTSQAWAIEVLRPAQGAPAPRQLAFAELVAGGTALTGEGSVQDLSADPSTNTTGPLTVTPNTIGDSLQLVAGNTTWVLKPVSLSSLGTDDALWKGKFRSEASENFGIDWTFDITKPSGSLTAQDDSGCTYEGTLTSVANEKLPHVVRVSYQSTNRDEGTTGAGPTRQQCGDWSGMGTVARDAEDNPVGRTLWLRKSGGGLLQRVSLEPVVPPTPES